MILTPTPLETMLNEIRKRLAMRPLFLWITGILIQVYFPIESYSALLLLPLACILGLSFFVKPTEDVRYSARFVWGFAFSLLFLFLAIQTTEYAILNLDSSLPPSQIETWAANMQDSLSKRFDLTNLSSEGKALLSTLCLGNRKELPWELRKQFSTAGVAHILAVSGFHVGVVFSFLNMLLARISIYGTWKWLRFAITVAILLLYLMISGMSSSTIRATAMIIIYFCSINIERTIDRYNPLATTALLMLIYNPLYLFDIGFQLSFSAVFAILYLNENLLKITNLRNPLIRIPYQWVMLSIAAQVGTLFLCLHYFGSTSLVFLFANIPVILLSSLLIPLSLVWLLLPKGFFFAAWIQEIIETLTQYLLLVVNKFGGTSNASFTLRLSTLETVLAYCFLIILVMFLQNRKKYIPLHG